jgi:hypothetical protein
MTVFKTKSAGVHAMVALASVVVVAILGAFDPATNSVCPPCLFRTATGWLCPGCGSARAIHALLHGDVRTALQMNSAAVFAIPLAGSDFLRSWVDTRGGWMCRLRPVYVWMIAGGIVAFGVLRNVVR